MAGLLHVTGCAAWEEENVRGGGDEIYVPLSPKRGATSKPKRQKEKEKEGWEPLEGGKVEKSRSQRLGNLCSSSDRKRALS